MATKKPALITRYKTALADLEKANNLIELLRNDFADLEKKLKTAIEQKDMYYGQVNDRNNELEQIHCILDAMPSPIPRKSGDDSMDTWSRKDLTLTTRLCAWLANR